MKKKRILIVFNNFGFGGIQKKISDLINYADSHKKNEVEIYLLFKKKSYLSFDFGKKLNRNQVRRTFYHDDQNYLIKRFTFPYFYLKTLLLTKPNTVLTYSQYLSPLVVILSKLLRPVGLNIVVSQDNILSYENKTLNSNKIYSKLISFSYNLANSVISQTKFAKKDLIKNFNIVPSKIRVIPNWKLNQDSKIGQTRKRPIDIVYLGRFAPQKNLSVFFEIASRLLAKQKLKIKLFGSGENEETFSILDYTKDRPEIEILHPTFTPLKVLRQSKILLMTSLFEGHPLVIIEAMSVGCIPVVIQYPGANEYIVNGKSGFIVKSQDQAVKKIQQLLQDNKYRNKISKLAQKEAKNFSENNIEKTLDVVI